MVFDVVFLALMCRDLYTLAINLADFSLESVCSAYK